MELNEIVELLNNALTDAYVYNSTIHKIESTEHFSRLIDRYGMQRVYEALFDSIAKGEFKWEDEYFFCDVEARGEFHSFTTKEELFAIVGRHNVSDMIEMEDF